MIDRYSGDAGSSAPGQRTIISSLRGDGLKAATFAVLTAAILLRLWNFAAARSLWTDEAMVAINIIHLPARALFGQLYFNQLAPVGWLLLEKAALQVSSDFDYSLRFVALIGGIGSVVLFWRFMRAVADSWETLAGVSLFGLTSALIAYSAMVKPYILDALFAIALLLLAATMLGKASHRLRITACYALVGLVCIPLSFGGAMVMAGTGLVLFAAALVRRDQPWAIALAATGCAWLALFAGLYVFVYAGQQTTVGNMTQIFWVDDFAPMPLSLKAIRWYPAALASALSFLLSRLGGLTATVFFLFGCYCIWRRDRWLLALLLSPFVIAVIASGLRAYPFETRFLLFLAPSAAVVVAIALVAAVRSFRYPALAAIALLLLFGAKPLWLTATSAAQIPAWPVEEVKSNLRYLSRHMKPGDALFLSVSAERPYLLYARRYGMENVRYQLLSRYRDSPTCINDDIRRITAARPAWLILYHSNTEEDKRSIAFMTRVLEQDGAITAADSVPGSELMRIEGPSSSDFAKVLPRSAPVCGMPREGKAFLETIAARIRSQGHKA